jgi:TRAP-type mannitol/chloroaromatic compound transport system substrate-binding protein
VAEIAAKDKMGKQVYASFKKFRDQAMAWHDVSEFAYYKARKL